MHDEPHPDAVFPRYYRDVDLQVPAASEPTLQWNVQPIEHAARLITFDQLTAVQALLVKLATGLLIEEAEIAYLRDLHQAGRFYSDPHPEVFLFCIGRRGGKTTIASRIASILGLRGPCRLFAGLTQDCDRLREGLRIPFAEVEVDAYHYHKTIGLSCDSLVMDNLPQGPSQPPNINRFDLPTVRYISLFAPDQLNTSLFETGRPTMAISLDQCGAYPLVMNFEANAPSVAVFCRAVR